jgi:hypothetical protein
MTQTWLPILIPESLIGSMRVELIVEKKKDAIVRFFQMVKSHWTPEIKYEMTIFPLSNLLTTLMPYDSLVIIKLYPLSLLMYT